MAFEPNTIVHLLNVPFSNDYQNVVWYPSVQAQTADMQAKIVRSFTDFTYQRKDTIIRVPAHIDTLWNCNYVMYQNRNHGDKWFYAFITKMEYIHDGLTHIHIETDVYQTWCFNIVIKDSFIEREHTVDDNPGDNLVAENFELGEYKCDTWTQDQKLNSSDIMVIGITETPGGLKEGGNRYGGVYSGITYLWRWTPKEVNTLINNYDSAGKAEAIQTIFMAPSWLALNGDDDESGYVETGAAAKFYDYNLYSPPTALDSYKPRNKKLLTYPYRYLLLTNNQGGSAILHNEKFKDRSRKFRIYGTITPGCSIRCVPIDYNGISENIDEGINLGKFPICNWNSDVFTNWITQNSINIATDVASGVLNTVGGAVTGGVLGAAGGLTSIASTVGQIHQHSIVPAQSKGNINCGDVIFAGDFNTFKFLDMSIKKDHAAIIDNFFDMFGYATHLVKTPYMNHRENWWYVKTNGLNCYGTVPTDDMEKFINIYNTGVTFWKKSSNVGDYSLSNGITV